MIIVIIAGGSGTRLWPLSTPDYPKQLLKLDGSDQSLLQTTYDRARKLTDKVYIATEASHYKHIKDQLKDLPEDAFVVEPGRRGTANAILASLAQITKTNDSDEPIAFIHSDHFIKDTEGFIKRLAVAAEVALEHNRLVLVGIEPNYPAIGFGYIQKGELVDQSKQVFAVSTFKEKPDLETAKQYFDSGQYLWNAGYFVGSINTFAQTMQINSPELYQNYKTLLESDPDSYSETYLSLKADAIDYALLEKTKDLLVVPADFDWMDLGSFSDVHEAVGKDENGNYIQGKVEIESTNNSLIQNYNDEPLVVIGLDDVVVINTGNGILVAHKEHAQKVGDVSKRINKEQ